MPELPVEIWATIFQQLVAIDDTTSCRTTLLLVSRSWFQTAIAVHQLWTHIEVTLAQTTTANRVLFYLFHSAALPLSVCITILEPPAPAIPNIMHLFAAHLYRIRLLKLRVSSHEVAEKALRVVRSGVRPTCTVIRIGADAKETAWLCERNKLVGALNAEKEFVQVCEGTSCRILDSHSIDEFFENL